MNKRKILKTVRLCALIPFLGLFLYALFISLLGERTFFGEPISGFEGFFLILIIWAAEFWWVFFISIAIIVGTSISLSSQEKPGILKIIRIIAFIPFILLFYVVLQNIIWGEGLIYGVYEAIELVSDPEGRFVFLVAAIIILVTSLFIRKNKECCAGQKEIGN